MPRVYADTQIANWNIEDITTRLDYINAHWANDGRFSHKNGVELLRIAERTLELAQEEKGFE